VATDYEGLIPGDIAAEVIRGASHASAAMTLGRTIRMPRGSTTLPVVSAVPTAAFVAARGGRKPASVVEWSTERIVPEEIGVLVAIPDDFIDDNSFPVWNEVRPLITDAIAYTFDMAVLWGVNEPATFPTGGVAAVAGPLVTGVTALEAVNEGMGQVEDSGLLPTGHAHGPSAGRTLRNLKDENGNLVYLPSITEGEPPSLFGLPLARTMAWDDTQADLITGDWTKLIIAIRSDIRFDLSSEAVLTDAEGVVTANAFQDDLTIMRAYFRAGVAIGRPVNVAGDLTDPFSRVSLTPEPEAGPSGARRRGTTGGTAAGAKGAIGQARERTARRSRSKKAAAATASE
jgi:HK97 family phage major capsid protein